MFDRLTMTVLAAGAMLAAAVSPAHARPADAPAAAVAAQSVDLELTATGPSEVQVNTQATYGVVVENLGPAGSPTETTFSIINTQTWRRAVSLTSSQGECTIEGTAPTCELGTIAAGASAQITAVYEADEHVRDDGNITFQVNVYNSDYSDPNLDNNRVDKPVRFVAPPPDPTPAPSPQPPEACSAAEGCALATPADRPDPGDSDLCVVESMKNALVNGCSTEAIVRAPQLAVEPAQDVLDEARADLTDMRSLRGHYKRAASLLEKSDKKLESVENELDRLDTCDAAKTAGSAVIDVKRARTATTRGSKAAAKRLDKVKLPKAKPGEDPHDLGALRLPERTHVGTAPASVKKAGLEVRHTATALRKLCRQTKKSRTVSGEVAGIGPQGYLILESGKQVSVAALDKAKGKSLLGPATFKGPVIGGVLYAETHAPKATKQPSGPPPSCAALRVVPVPAARIYSDLPVAGYETSPGQLLLEAGVGFHAKRTCVPPAQPGKRLKYFLQVRIKRGESQQSFLYEADKPVPGSALTVSDAGKKVTLDVTEIAVACDASGTFCGDSKMANPPAPSFVVSEKSYVATVLGQRQAGAAVLGETVFAAPDRPNAFGGTTPLGVSTNGNPLPNAQLVAIGRRAQVKGEFDITVTGPQEVVSGQTIAITSDSHPSALDRPQIIGQRNGSTYAYTANQPKVITDLVARCNRSEALYKNTDAYFLLPWKAGDRAAVYQGAKDQGLNSHADQPGVAAVGGYWAWDLGAEESDPDPAFQDGEEIIAARGGRVDFVEESQTTLGSGEMNFIVIEHQDGTAATYGHQKPNTIGPKKGDRVRRGTVLGQMSWVGPASGPHLHMSSWSSTNAKDPTVEATQPILFSGRRSTSNTFAGPFEQESCGILKNGEVWESTNEVL